jgi:hypothetical protein
MFLGRQSIRGSVKPASGHEERGRSRLGRYLVLILGTGAVSGTAALAGIPPFGSLQALLAPISQLLHPQQAPTLIQASSIFPPVPPVHQTVDVYDPAPPAARPNPAPQPPAIAPSPTPKAKAKASPTPPLHSSPSPSPGGGD